MKIGFFTDTYFPQVSGVATSIKTLKTELEKKGHEVYIFTTTDPNATGIEEDIIRMPSVPFVSFKDRRIVVRGMWYAYLIAKELELDLIHTHTEFGAGLLGKMVGKKLKVPVIHTYHTMYEDYLHYIAKGKVVRQSHVKYFSRLFANHTTGVVCPSERVIDTLRGYGVTSPMRVIPTGIELEKFERPDITSEMKEALRRELGITDNQIMLLSLSRISYEKNIQAIIHGLPKVIAQLPQTRLVIVGKGPYTEELKELVQSLNLGDYVCFVGEVPNDEVALYYHAADYFVSASTSETQGLTYTEAMAAGTPLVVEGNDYLNNLIDDSSFGVTFASDDDFADAVLNYIASGLGSDPQKLSNKLYEISATHFGESMLDFYHDMIAYYANLSLEKETEPTMQKIKVKLYSFKRTSN
ncbi:MULTISPECIES: glycosyltransferase family 4 protein [Enterococcus]|uniref:Glycosyl transferase n=1 Tax=Enterococcus dispar ATCC 51266 TaxID=1139219 RepID=S1N7B1_9ENTE|nr:glycosyltransferase family 4 protein [Enterococcus dispar]EOT42652.1 glycosyl transferase [Enterococcus dispar ATCC 51266]EOW84897.1 glycosyl transferase [Enterococcus dispar ATCC 51266]OJG37966.1 glycosyl transferase [Enterococcus dispar]WCG33505.1 glycosyltransferase family 4 protein [Enterococcus dispar]